MCISLQWYTSDNITMESTNHPPQDYTTMSAPSTIEYGHWEKTERKDNRERNVYEIEIKGGSNLHPNIFIKIW